MIDKIADALAEVQASYFAPSVVILNPRDSFTIKKTKTTTGQYLNGFYQEGSLPFVWGVRVIESNTIPQGTFLTGDFAAGATLYAREGATIEIGAQDEDNFKRNLVTIKGEERYVLAIQRPKAFAQGSFIATAGGGGGA